MLTFSSTNLSFLPFSRFRKNSKILPKHFKTTLNHKRAVYVNFTNNQLTAHAVKNMSLFSPVSGLVGGSLIGKISSSVTKNK